MISQIPSDALPTPRGRFSKRDLARILFRYRRRAAAALVGILALTFGAVIVWPRTYVSEAKLLVKIGKESIRLDPTATVGEVMPVSESRESEIQTILDMMGTRELFAQVVDRVGVEAILKQKLPADSAEREGETAAVGEQPSLAASVLNVPLQTLRTILRSDDVSPREEAIQRVQSWISMGSEKRSSVIWLKCLSGSPELSQRLLAEYIDAYRAHHMAIHHMDGSHGFFDQQTELQGTNLTQAMEALRDAKNDVGVVSIDVQRKIIESQMISLNNQLSESEAALLTASRRIDALQRQHPELLRLPERERTSLSPKAIDEMNAALYQLQIRREELRSKYGERHPALQAIEQQEREAQRILTRQELLVEKAAADNTQARLDSLKQERQALVTRLRTLNDNEVRINELEQQVDLLKKHFQNYSERGELARMDDELRHRQLTNVRVDQEPSLVQKAVSPSKLFVLALGFMTAMLAALGIPIVSELLDHTVGTPEQAEDALDLPVLLTIPEFQRQRVLLN